MTPAEFGCARWGELGTAPSGRLSAPAGKNAVSAAALADGYCAVLSFVREARLRALTSAAQPRFETLAHPATLSCAHGRSAPIRGPARRTSDWGPAPPRVRYRDPRRSWPRARAYASRRTLGADRRLNQKCNAFEGVLFAESNPISLSSLEPRGPRAQTQRVAASARLRVQAAR
jgi:hypothetical protein